jgi:uncharacterized protein (UPF0210 family)
MPLMPHRSAVVTVALLGVIHRAQAVPARVGLPVRTITVGISRRDLAHRRIHDRLARLGDEVLHLEQHHPVRTRRLVLTPVDARELESGEARHSIEVVAALAANSPAHIRWFNVPFDLTQMSPSQMAHAVDLAEHTVARHSQGFTNLIVSHAGGLPSGAATDAAAALIARSSRLRPDGSANFRVGIALNGRHEDEGLKAPYPFFPKSFQPEGAPSGLSLGLELTPLFHQLFDDPAHGRNGHFEAVADRVAPLLRDLEDRAVLLAERSGFHYRGIDLSLAPLAQGGDENSVARLVARAQQRILGGPDSFGIPGLTGPVIGRLKAMLRLVAQKSGIRTAGYGNVLISRAEDRGVPPDVPWDELLEYSAFSALGPDMWAVPGDVRPADLRRVIRLTAWVSRVRNAKPLAIRLLPIPGAHPGDMTGFSTDEEFIYDTRVMSLEPRRPVRLLLRSLSQLEKPTGI